MQHIETVTVGSGGAASITFSAIPDTYTDLLLVTSIRTARSAGDEVMDLVFNGADTNRTTRNLRAEGASVQSSSLTNLGDGWANAATSTASTFASTSIYIPNYRSNVAKSYSIDSVTETNGTAVVMSIVAGLWNSTDPVTSLTIKSQNDSTLVEFSSASLYGITAGSDGIVSVA